MTSENQLPISKCFARKSTARLVVCVLLSFSTLGAASNAFAAITPEQREAELEIATINGAMATWVADQVSLLDPGAGSPDLLGGGFCTGQEVIVAAFPDITHQDLEAILVPTYLPSLPFLDPWGHPYQFFLAPSPIVVTDFAAIRSLGSDGIEETSVYLRGAVDEVSDDLFWANLQGVRTLPLAPFQRQPKTRAEMREVGTALVNWVTDQALSTPAAPRQETSTGVIDLDVFVTISPQALADLLVPLYLQCLPDLDPWGHPYEYWLDVEDILGSELMAIRSVGEDGVASGNTYQQGSFPSIDQDQDLVWADGFFVRFPADDGLFFFDGFETGDTCSWTTTFP